MILFRGFDMPQEPVVNQTFFALLDNEIQRARRELRSLKNAVDAYKGDSLFVSAVIDKDWALKGMASLSLQKIYGNIESVLAKIIVDIDDFKIDAEGDHSLIIEAAATSITGLRPAIISSDLKNLLTRLKTVTCATRKTYLEDISIYSLLEHVEVADKALPMFANELLQFKRAMTVP